MTLDSEGGARLWRAFFLLISLNLSLFLTFKKVSLFTKSVFDLLRSYKVITEDSSIYILWCPFIGGAPRKFSEAP